jgi:hypothetical protein
MILEALKRGRKITPLEALRNYGCLRLGARIYDLKKAGHAITREMVELADGKHVARYSMRRKAA